MSGNEGLIYGSRLDGRGGGERLDHAAWSRDAGERAGTAPGEPAPTAGAAPVWLHLDYSAPSAQDWLRTRSGLDPLIAEALLATETRPRVLPHGDGLLLNLRGVNLNPGADPEDMVSIRLWIDGRRILTLRRHHLKAVEDLKEALARGVGPRDAGEFLVALCERLAARMAGVVEQLDDEVDALEEGVLETESRELRPRISQLRRRAIALRRYLAPQREAMTQLVAERPSWLADAHRLRLREVADRITRYVEDLDAARDRATVTQEELGNRLSEQLNQKMYVVALVATVFLPLSLLTGLLGINVAGIPGSSNAQAFAVVCGLLVAVAAIEVWALWRGRWL